MRARLRGDKRWFDIGAVVVLLIADAGAASALSADAREAVAAVAFAFLVHGPLVQRRRWPVAVAVLVAAGVIGRSLLDVPNLTAELPLLLAAHALGTVAPQQHRFPIAALAGVVAVACALSGSTGPSGWLLTGVAVAGACLVGAEHRRYSELLRRSLREQRGRRARELADERTRIAADLHDVVGHHLSAISVQTYLLDDLARGQQPELARAASGIRESGRRAVTELGDLVAELRSEIGAPRHGVDGIPELVRAAGVAGNDVELRFGEMPETLPAEVGVETYRVLREALTNVVKHSSPTRVVVQLGAVGGVLRVTVANDRCRTDRPRRLFPGTGFGVRGMRERVRRLGGRLEAGRVAGGGYRVRAMIPLDANREVESVVDRGSCCCS
ncbi:sensor histidine kinase [Allokutzneria oryzae]|uniref:histidine kinase n=1 Tax=Allokutzneria oryzae TaxID=1378989 RepID=A0ABV6A1Q9_9PSEU